MTRGRPYRVRRFASRSGIRFRVERGRIGETEETGTEGAGLVPYRSVMFHIAVGSVRYRGNADFSEFPFVRTETACEDGSANMFFFGTSSEFDGSAKIVEFLRERVDELLSFDVSVDSEDRIALLVSDMPKGTYSVMAYHGPTFENVERSLR